MVNSWFMASYELVILRTFYFKIWLSHYDCSYHWLQLWYEVIISWLNIAIIPQFLASAARTFCFALNRNARVYQSTCSQGVMLRSQLVSRVLNMFEQSFFQVIFIKYICYQLTTAYRHHIFSLAEGHQGRQRQLGDEVFPEAHHHPGTHSWLQILHGVGWIDG